VFPCLVNQYNAIVIFAEIVFYVFGVRQYFIKNAVVIIDLTRTIAFQVAG